MKQFKIKVVTILCILICVSLTIFSDQAKLGIINSINCCLNILIPSMFPFLIISSFAVLSEVQQVLGKVLAPITRLLHLPKNTAAVIILSLSCGYPTGAVMISSMLDRQEISQQHARELLKFCFNSGLPFAVTAVGSVMLSSKKAGFILYISTTLSSIAIALIGTAKRQKILSDYSDLTFSMPINEAMVQCVKNATFAMANVCAYVLIFGCVEQMIALPDKIKVFTLPFLEITTGTMISAGKVPLWAIALFLGFGGLCIHCQVSSTVIKAKMKMYHFIIYRAIGALSSALIAYFIEKLFPVTINTAFTTLYSGEFVSISVPVSILMIIMSLVLIIDIDNKKKLC